MQFREKTLAHLTLKITYAQHTTVLEFFFFHFTDSEIETYKQEVAEPIHKPRLLDSDTLIFLHCSPQHKMNPRMSSDI